MSECFDSKVSVTQTILDPRSDTKHVIDFQYERERRTPKPIPSPKNYLFGPPVEISQTAISATLQKVGFDAPLASTIAREFVELP
jgi:hypothetical protein